MSLLFETIACIKGVLQNLEWHQARLNRSLFALFHSTDEINLTKIEVPELAKKGIWKCRITYDISVQKIEFEPYTPRKLETLRLIESNLDYNYKFKNRNKLKSLFKKRGTADDILIIRNGFVTDSSIANVLLYDGIEWITPSTPLLEGTMRAQLLHLRKIKAKPVRKSDLASYKKLMLINVMNPFDESKALELPKAILD